jgi:hypothetical protein
MNKDWVLSVSDRGASLEITVAFTDGAFHNIQMIN